METDIITIGDEILIGQIVDTNSAWMAQKLNDSGIHVRQIISISDDPQHIQETLRESARSVPLVLITGGLGPTRDDKTKSAICTYFDTQLIMDDQVLQNVIHLLGKRGISLNQLNREQALVPESALVIQNELGTAPCLWLKKNDCNYIFMPGVPFEMKNLMETEIIPRIQREFDTPAILHRTIQIYGLAESALAEKISRWEDSLDESVKVAYLPGPEGIRLRLSSWGKEKNQVEKDIQEKIEELNEIIPEYIIGYGEETISAKIGELLMEKGLTVSTAESCTGGYIAHSITSIPGSSAYFKGSVVAYSNEIKRTLLSIDPKNLVKYGAVSQEVVEEMAAHARKLFGTDYAVATSGIAGPSGGSETKPVGMVWIAIDGPGGMRSKVYNFGNDRQRNIIRSSQTALNTLRLILLEQNLAD